MNEKRANIYNGLLITCDAMVRFYLIGGDTRAAIALLL